MSSRRMSCVGSRLHGSGGVERHDIWSTFRTLRPMPFKVPTRLDVSNVAKVPLRVMAGHENAPTKSTKRAARQRLQIERELGDADLSSSDQQRESARVIIRLRQVLLPRQGWGPTRSVRTWKVAVKRQLENHRNHRNTRFATATSPPQGHPRGGLALDLLVQADHDCDDRGQCHYDCGSSGQDQADRFETVLRRAGGIKTGNQRPAPSL